MCIPNQLQTYITEEKRTFGKPDIYEDNTETYCLLDVMPRSLTISFRTLLYVFTKLQSVTS